MIKDQVLQSFDKKNVLVTGGTGLIGRQVVNLLHDAGANIRIISLDEVNINNNVEHIFGDLTDFNLCLDATKGMDAVFHFAGIKGSAKVSTSLLASHFVPTMMFNLNVLEACRQNKVEKVLYTSSIGAYANNEIFVEGEPGDFDDAPMDFAGWAKRMGELQIHAYKIQHELKNFSIIRPSNVYGPGDNFDPENAMVIGALMNRIYAGENPLMVWGDGTAIRDIAFSRDVAEGAILALHHGTDGRYVNIGSGQGVSIKQLVETLNQFLDFEYDFDITKPSGYPKRIMDISLARKMIDYNPDTELLDGLKQTWDWYLTHKDEYKMKKNYFNNTSN